MSLQFNGSSDKLVNTSTAAITAAGATICAWVRPANLTTQMVAAGVFRSTVINPYMRLGISSTGTATCAFRNDANSQSAVTDGTALSTSAFTFILATFDTSGVARLYVSGTLVGTGSNPSDTVITLDKTSIGLRSHTGEDNFFNGYIAEVGMWSRVLDSTEISNLASGHAPSCRTTNLALYQDLIDAENEPGTGGTPTYGPVMTRTGGTWAAGTHPTIDYTCGGSGTTFNVSGTATNPHGLALVRSTTLLRTVTAPHTVTIDVLKTLIVSVAATCAHVLTLIAAPTRNVSVATIASHVASLQRQASLIVSSVAAHVTPTLTSQGYIKGITTDVVTLVGTARLTKQARLIFSTTKSAVASVTVSNIITIAVSVSTTVAHAATAIRTAQINLSVPVNFVKTIALAVTPAAGHVYAIAVTAAVSFQAVVNKTAQIVKRKYTGGAGLGLHMKISRHFRPWKRRR